MLTGGSCRGTAAGRASVRQKRPASALAAINISTAHANMAIEWFFFNFRPNWPKLDVFFPGFKTTLETNSGQ
jgi:hypothetical protein